MPKVADDRAFPAVCFVVIGAELSYLAVFQTNAAGCVIQRMIAVFTPLCRVNYNRPFSKLCHLFPILQNSLALGQGGAGDIGRTCIIKSNNVTQRPPHHLILPPQRRVTEHAGGFVGWLLEIVW